jgi:hypothetical protein
VDRILAGVCLTLCLTVISCGDEAPAVEADCIPAVQVGETMLPSHNTSLARDLPPRAGKVRVRGWCQKAEQTLETRRGVPPTVAVFPPFPYERGRVRVNMYLADDAIVAVRGHPLHQSFFGRQDVPDYTGGRRCSRVAFDGKVLSVGSFSLLVERGAREVMVRAEARTTVRAPVLDGVPRLAAGAAVRVRAVRCEGRRHLVARRLTVR